MTAARGISPDAKYAGCFLLVTFLLRQKKSNKNTPTRINTPKTSKKNRQGELPCRLKRRLKIFRVGTP